MPRLKWPQHALRDIALYDFLLPKSPVAARRHRGHPPGIKALGKHPQIGRPVEDSPPEFREWSIEFGQSAYVVLFRYEGKEAVILAVRHGREAGY